MQWNADSVFAGLVGRAPPFLFAFGTHATFMNCMFKDVVLPRSELFDVSHYGSVSLINCHFANITTGRQENLVDTSYNDFHPVRPYAGYIRRDIDGFYNDYALDLYKGYYGDLDHINYDVLFAPAASDAEEVYGSDYFIHNQTMSDCLASSLGATQFVLPGCPGGSVNVRRQRAIEEQAGIAYAIMQRDSANPQQVRGPTSASLAGDVSDYQWLIDYQYSRQAKGVNTFYAQYYPEYSDYPYQEYFDPRGAGLDYPAPAPYASDYIYDASAPQRQPDYRAYHYIISDLGDQLSADHPWFEAVQQVCMPVPHST